MIGLILTGTAAVYGGEVLGFAWRFSIILWAFSGFLLLGPNYLVALIRYKGRAVSWTDACYYWTSHEQSAYARTQAEFDGQRARWEKT